MAAPFKVGEHVECVNASAYGLKEGKFYLIKGVEYSHGARAWFVRVDDSDSNELSALRFVPIPEGHWVDGFGVMHKEAT